MILRRVRRLVQEQLENSGEGIRNFFSWFILAVPAWILWVFFQPLTFNFWIAATCIALSSLLIWSRRYRSAVAICGALVVYCIILSFRVTYIVASDQQGISYRQVAESSYLELPSNFPIIGMMPASFIRSKLISIISCGGMKVAKLPLLPFSATKADSPLQFRRFFPLSREVLRAYIETSVGPSDHQHEISFGMSFSHPSDDSIALTDIFPRSISCVENSLPLIPVIEILPWNPDQTNELVSAVAKVFLFRDAYLHSQITPHTVRSLTLDSDSNYKSLLDFTSEYLKFVMLQGNLFAESRADIRNRLCIIIESNPGAFSGPFSSLSNQMKRELAYTAGRTFRSIYPACRIDDDVFNEIESLPTNSQEFPNWVTAMSNCSRSETADELLSCLRNSPFYHRRDANCEESYCGAALTSEGVIRFYERPFNKHVVSREGRLIEPSTLDSVECPNLRDSAEDLYLLNWRGERSWSIWHKPIQCSSADWQSRFIQSKEDRRAQLRCARQKGFGGPTDDDTDMLYDLTHIAHCSPSADKMMTPSFLTPLLQMADDAGEFKTTLVNNYADWVGLRRTEEIIKAITLTETFKASLCGQSDAQQCIEHFGDVQMRQRFAELINPFFGQLSANADASSQLKEMFDLLSQSDNIVAKIGICDLLARSEVSQLVGLSRDSYCRSHGLSRYIAVSERYDGDSLEKSFEKTNGTVGTTEIRMVSPSGASRSYGRDWKRELFLDRR